MLFSATIRPSNHIAICAAHMLNLECRDLVDGHEALTIS